jgi:hypothetical protein
MDRKDAQQFLNSYMYTQSAYRMYCNIPDGVILHNIEKDISDNNWSLQDSKGSFKDCLRVIDCKVYDPVYDDKIFLTYLFRGNRMAEAFESLYTLEDWKLSKPIITGSNNSSMSNFAMHSFLGFELENPCETLVLASRCISESIKEDIQKNVEISEDQISAVKYSIMHKFGDHALDDRGCMSQILKYLGERTYWYSYMMCNFSFTESHRNNLYTLFGDILKFNLSPGLYRDVWIGKMKKSTAISTRVYKPEIFYKTALESNSLDRLLSIKNNSSWFNKNCEDIVDIEYIKKEVDSVATYISKNRILNHRWLGTLFYFRKYSDQINDEFFNALLPKSSAFYPGNSMYMSIGSANIRSNINGNSVSWMAYTPKIQKLLALYILQNINTEDDVPYLDDYDHNMMVPLISGSHCLKIDKIVCKGGEVLWPEFKIAELDDYGYVVTGVKFDASLKVIMQSSTLCEFNLNINEMGVKKHEEINYFTYRQDRILPVVTSINRMITDVPYTDETVKTCSEMGLTEQTKLVTINDKLNVIDASKYDNVYALTDIARMKVPEPSRYLKGLKVLLDTCHDYICRRKPTSRFVTQTLDLHHGEDFEIVGFDEDASNDYAYNLFEDKWADRYNYMTIHPILWCKLLSHNMKPRMPNNGDFALLTKRLRDYSEKFDLVSDIQKQVFWLNGALRLSCNVFFKIPYRLLIIDEQHKIGSGGKDPEWWNRLTADLNIKVRDEFEL